MTKQAKEALVKSLLDEGLAENEQELMWMLEDMGTTLEEIDNGEWF